MPAWFSQTQRSYVMIFWYAIVLISSSNAKRPKAVKNFLITSLRVCPTVYYGRHCGLYWKSFTQAYVGSHKHVIFFHIFSTNLYLTRKKFSYANTSIYRKMGLVAQDWTQNPPDCREESLIPMPLHLYQNCAHWVSRTRVIFFYFSSQWLLNCTFFRAYQK